MRFRLITLLMVLAHAAPVLAQWPDSRMGRHEWNAPTTLNKLWLYATCAVLVALLWAIIYRREIQSKRVSLKAVFVLIVLECLDFAAIKFFRGW